ncbi:MAG: class I SAM-dependent methyltransferase [Acidimicrobiales bacterium]
MKRRGHGLSAETRRGHARAEGAGLLLVTELPTLHVQRRDPEAVLSFFRDPTQDVPPGEQRPIFASPRLAAVLASDAPLATEIAAFPWYHTIELPGGLVTPGFFDHRPLVPHYGLPTSLARKRVADVGTFDGFWAFELEERGAAEVIAIDLERASQTDMPPQARALIVERDIDLQFGRGFALASKARASTVERKTCSVYDLDAATLGPFDFVHMADVLLHLERPLEALRRVRSIVADDGEALIADSISLELEGCVTEYLGGWSGVVWWRPSLDALAQMVIDAGFGSVELRQIYNLADGPARAGEWRAVLSARP